MAAITGAIGIWSAGAAQPAAAARPAAIGQPAASGGQNGRASLVAGRLPAPSAAEPAQLDAVLAVSATQHAKALVSDSKVTAKGKRFKLTPRRIARRMLPRFHWSGRQFPYLDRLWSRESSWNVHAENLYSGAYGIPQAVPGGKMSSAGPHWQSDARTQIRWGLDYIRSRYGSPEGAWDHELTVGWY